jgi:hypothetical protein
MQRETLDDDAILQQLDIELARAEAVVIAASDPCKKAHEPTVENHRGQILALRKAIALFEMRQHIGPVYVTKEIKITAAWPFVFFMVFVIWLLFLS